MLKAIREAKKEDYKKLPGSFWVITSFYNPDNVKSKIENYKFFAKNLKRQGVNLLTVECAFEKQEFQLKNSDCDKLIQVRSTSVLWQKERLLNIGLENLSDDCDKIAWLDADLVFTNDNWAKETALALETYHLVKPFSEALRLTKKESEQLLLGASLNQTYSQQHKNVNHYYNIDSSDFLIYLAVFGMCARREIFAEAGFYDKMIIYSGDLVIANAFVSPGSCALNLIEKLSLAEDMKKDIDDWYDKLPKNRGSLPIACLEGSLVHLFHGLFINKNYRSAFDFFERHKFNPKQDLRINEQGCFDWSSNKPKLHRELIKYFQVRNEDDKFGRNIILVIKIIIRIISKEKKQNWHKFLGLIGFKIKNKSPRLYIFLKRILKPGELKK